MWPEMLDWTVCRALAAREKLPWSAIATRAASWRRSTEPVLPPAAVAGRPEQAGPGRWLSGGRG